MSGFYLETENRVCTPPKGNIPPPPQKNFFSPDKTLNVEYSILGKPFRRKMLGLLSQLFGGRGEDSG